MVAILVDPAVKIAARELVKLLLREREVFVQLFYRLEPSYRSVPRKTWYSPSGRKMTGGGYNRRLKRQCKAVREQEFNITANFGRL